MLSWTSICTSIFYLVGPFKCVFQLLLAEFTVAILVHSVYEFHYLQLGRGMITSHVL